MPYRYSEKLGRYIDTRTRRMVPWSEVRGALDAAIDSSSRTVNTLSQQLREGAISLEQWRGQVQQELRQVHLASVALAKGGHAQLTQADYGRVGGLVAREYRYLEAFTRQIENGQQPLDGRFLQRSEQYTKAGRETYHRQERVEQARRGFDEERSIRHADDSCGECIAEEERGWVALGEIKPVGARLCRKNCLCSIAYRNTATGEERAA